MERLRAHLREAHGVEDEFFETVARENDEIAQRMRADVLTMSPPRFEDAFAKAYAEQHPLIDAERAEYLDYQAGFAPQDETDDHDTRGADA